MSYSRYNDADWENRFGRVSRARDGFAWGAFFIGLIVGAILL